jgi:hypothetical protein
MVQRTVSSVSKLFSKSSAELRGKKMIPTLEIKPIEFTSFDAFPNIPTKDINLKQEIKHVLEIEEVVERLVSRYKSSPSIKFNPLTLFHEYQELTVILALPDMETAFKNGKSFGEANLMAIEAEVKATYGLEYSFSY